MCVVPAEHIRLTHAASDVCRAQGTRRSSYMRLSIELTERIVDGNAGIAARSALNILLPYAKELNPALLELLDYLVAEPVAYIVYFPVCYLSVC